MRGLLGKSGMATRMIQLLDQRSKRDRSESGDADRAGLLRSQCENRLTSVAMRL